MVSHNTKAYRRWRKLAITNSPYCHLCNTTQHLEVHHKYDMTHYPKKAYKQSNAVVLCKQCHSDFHILFKGSTRARCTEKDFIKYEKLFNRISKRSAISKR